jgi:putative FmdB family regulatory protein
MPTYDYECRKCRHRFEIFEAISAESVKPCPACGRKSAHRAISGGAGLLFRGPGFYITDYRRPAPAEAPARPAACAGGKPAEGCACAAEKNSSGKKP